MKARLILEDGTVFKGKAFGYLEESVGEVVFNTSMAGYGEILTDPTYYGQIVTITYPLVGNYGISLEDVQSKDLSVKGFIVREKSDTPNNFRNEMSLDVYLKQNKVIGLEGIDTRALTKMITRKGTMKGIITLDENATFEDVKTKIEGFDNSNAVSAVSRTEKECFQGSGTKVAIIDYGVKNYIINDFVRKGCDVTVYPATTTAEEILGDNPDLIFLSNGPGNPADVCDSMIETVKELAGKKPMIGIGLGHQIVAMAFGGKTSELKFGHRGGNHPVKDLALNKIFITAQNHGYYVSEVPECMEVTHVNLNDNTVEGMKHKELPICTFQYHPDSCPASKDNMHIYKAFLEVVEGK